MILDTILNKCNERYLSHDSTQCCPKCTYIEYCPHNCEKCLDYIHTPAHAQEGSPERKYDCANMADFYTCKYSYRYTSEMIYAFQRLRDIHVKQTLKVLSFGCGPCTDLFALDYLKNTGTLNYSQLYYRGVDYSKDVWEKMHADIKSLQSSNLSLKFFYKDACTFIDEISQGAWIPDLVVFQYVFSDMRKHSDAQAVTSFVNKFASFVNNFMLAKSYIVLNDINLGINYGGGREYFDRLYKLLNDAIMYKGRFCDDNAKSPFYPRGYTYGEDSDGEFPKNANFFTWPFQWKSQYSPFNTCSSAQMLLKKEG